MKFRHIIYPLLFLAMSAASPALYAANPQQELSDTLMKTDISATDVELVMKVFDGQKPSVIIPRADIFIKSGKNPEEIAKTAYYVYEYYRQSKIMGYDEIAIYIADNYFLNHKYELPDKEIYMAMKLYADSNRQSLIGMKAAPLELEDPAGNKVQVGNDNSDYRVLYFYDDECPACKKTTTPLLQSMIRLGKSLNITLYMIYTQNDRERWMDYIQNETGRIRLPERIKTVHLWDPELKSGFVTKYGVISTPKLFLTDRYGTIIGRDLTPMALTQVIDIYENALSPLEMIFEQVFQPLGEKTDTIAVVEAIDGFFEDSKDNPELFHELFYNLYQYLKTSGSYTLQQGAAYLGNKYIAGMPELWETVTFTDTGESKGSVIRADFSSPQEFIDQTALGVLMFYRNMLDRPAADLALRTVKNKVYSIYDADAKYTVLYFYSLDCSVCNHITPEMKKLSEKYADSGVVFLGIYTGTDKEWKKAVKQDETKGWTDLWDRKRESDLFNKYDLLDVPAIYLLDENKKTLAKDINPDILSAILEVFLTSEEK